MIADAKESLEEREGAQRRAKADAPSSIGATPPCAGAPPRVWTRGPDRAPWEDADSGHRVLAIRRGDAWVFWAFGPDRRAGWSYRAWANGEAPHWSGSDPPVRYAIGEHVPQPRVFLGEAASAADARALCERDAAGGGA